MLGLTSGKTFTDGSFHNRNYRRKIFHDFPNGAYPLTALLSLMDHEETDSTRFGWHEKRYVEPSTLTIATSEEPISPSGSDVGIASPVDIVSGTVYRLKVADSSKFKVRHQIQISGLIQDTTDAALTLQGVITAIISSTAIEFRAIESVLDIVNNTASITPGPGTVGAKVEVVGNASAEGALSEGHGRLTLPIEVDNFTQIFRTPFSFTRSALKQPTEFDKTGIYKEKSKDNMIDHAVEMEKAFLFGSKSVTSVTENGETVPLRTTGGVLHFLKAWEAADSIYRGGTGAPAVTLNTDDNKRIISVAGAGSVSGAEFSGYLERLFLVTNDKSFEKIFLCGNGFLAAVNAYFEGKATIFKNFKAEDTYGMNITSWETPFGTVHFGTHPLFNRNPSFRYSAFALDIQNLRYRALNDSDTELLKNRQPNDYDGRKDEWLTESGLEVRYPESHMFFENLRTITA